MSTESRTPHKSGFVNIIGNPNVGKSTLMNAFMGEKLSIITPKAQTTRHRISGILNGDDYQIVFSDTPGVIRPHYRLQSAMMNTVKSSFEDADIIIYMVEVGEKEPLKDESLFHKLQQSKLPLFLLINKVDLSNQEEVEQFIQNWQELLPKSEVYPMSAKTGFFVKELLDKIIYYLPIAKPYFPKDSFTDKPERFFVSEMIREKILLFYKKEIPYSVEVVIDSFVEEEHIIRVEGTIITERETQRAIILGHKGISIKRVGTHARRDMEIFFNKKIYLRLYVKVIKDWRKKDNYIDRFGYND